MKIIKSILFGIIIVFLASCSEDEPFGEVNDDLSPYYHPGTGLFIVNEGNYTHGNASLSFYNSTEDKMYNNVFYQENDRPLGDVTQSLSLDGEQLFVIVNNSAVIEVLRLSDMKSLATIEGFTSPRHMIIVNEHLAYVSDLYEPFIWMLDLDAMEISGKIQTGKAVENMLLVQGKVYACNWTSLNAYDNTSVQVIDIENNTLINEIPVVKEPNSIILDDDGFIWVLSSGGYANEEQPSLQRINPESQSVDRNLVFDNIQSSPSSLCYSNGEIYYLNQGVWKLSDESIALPQEVFIEQDGNLYYGLSVTENNIFVSDAVDYQQNGDVFIFEKNALFEKKLSVGIIPGFMLAIE